MSEQRWRVKWTQPDGHTGWGDYLDPSAWAMSVENGFLVPEQPNGLRLALVPVDANGNEVAP